MIDTMSTDSYSNVVRNVFCNNCRKYGHIFNKCKMPIVSYGVVVCRINPTGNVPEYLMICRRRTLGYIDFMRGKYSTTNKFYIINMMKQMTTEEKQGLLRYSFDELWKGMWNNNEELALVNNDENSGNSSSISCNSQYKQEEMNSKSKFNTLSRGVQMHGETYSIASLVEESSKWGDWEEQEWGFPKGRRNYQENEYDCAVREFTEETGYSGKLLKMVVNLYPFEEVFMGSNYKSYKHKYFLTFMDYNESLKHVFSPNTEVSKMEWKTVDACMEKIRPYNDEKKRLFHKVNTCLYKYII